MNALFLYWFKNQKFLTAFYPRGERYSRMFFEELFLPYF